MLDVRQLHLFKKEKRNWPDFDEDYMSFIQGFSISAKSSSSSTDSKTLFSSVEMAGGIIAKGTRF